MPVMQSTNRWGHLITVGNEYACWTHGFEVRRGRVATITNFSYGSGYTPLRVYIQTGDGKYDTWPIDNVVPIGVRLPHESRWFRDTPYVARDDADQRRIEAEGFLDRLQSLVAAVARYQVELTNIEKAEEGTHFDGNSMLTKTEAMRRKREQIERLQKTIAERRGNILNLIDPQ